MPYKLRKSGLASYREILKGSAGYGEVQEEWMDMGEGA